ncbi:MAG: LapA family protein [Burkholderiales bacterium]
MQYLMLLIKFALFLLILSFAIVNTDPVTVRYYLGFRWDAPLVVVLLIAVCLGAAAGLLAGLFQVLRLRREVAALKRELRVARELEKAAEPAIMPPMDML